MAKTPPKIPIVDAHLDMAGNVLGGRDYDLTAAEVRAVENKTREQVMVTLPELRRGDVAVVFGTLYTGTRKFDDNGAGIYERPPDESARRQLAVYLEWERDNKARIIRDRRALESHLDAWQEDGLLGIVVLIEGGDSITSPDDLASWWDAGVRIIGPAWSKTRYCGGTRMPGGLTDLGRELLSRMRQFGFVLDVSHMAEQSFWDAMNTGFHRVIATHANARRLVPGKLPDRHLSDEMLTELGKHDGVIGIVPANPFLDDDHFGQTDGELTLTLDAVRKHLEHMASIVGWNKVGIGSDLDGGFGVEETPVELDSVADLVKIGGVVPPEAREGVLGGNWLRVLSESLP